MILVSPIARKTKMKLLSATIPAIALYFVLHSLMGSTSPGGLNEWAIFFTYDRITQAILENKRMDKPVPYARVSMDPWNLRPVLQRLTSFATEMGYIDPRCSCWSASGIRQHHQKHVHRCTRFHSSRSLWRSEDSQARYPSVIPRDGLLQRVISSVSTRARCIYSI